tara:strand:- start:989 stop:1393 length:405 start_codon:yes stop_codon:yes gene_type:complete
MMTNPLLNNKNTNIKTTNIKTTNIKTTNIKNTNYNKISDPMVTCDSDISNNLLEECIICFHYIKNTDEYYFCKNCFIPAHKKCYQEWWFNQYKKYGLCVHCQGKNKLILLKPYVKRSRVYSFVLYMLRKIGCYT